MAPTTSEARPQDAKSQRFAGLRAFRDRVRARPGGALGWRIGVTFVSVVVIAGGVLLLPLPGPGWVIIFAGLGLLATEYDWARRLLTFARQKVQEWTQWLGRKPIWVRALVGLAIFVLVAACLYLAWRLTR
ncbi:TIGR02611 family protein [uncultured Jatrophihabitans sp.]|uniref:TIGR02611 family protein n=1 Tax=uncultured Jatrophihabitans sp. TaxID=1610747 RepID=UPI0035CA8189